MVRNGERAFVTHRTGAAFPPFTPEDIHLAPPAHIHIGEASTLVDNPDLVTTAKSIGATVSLDCSWDDNLEVAKLTTLLPEIDVFLPNAAEAELLRDRGVSEPFSRLSVIKKGQNGASAKTADAEFHAPALPTTVIDPTGAGDAFNAAFLSAWLNKMPIEACLRAGNQKGAEAVSFRGGLGGILSKSCSD